MIKLNLKSGIIILLFFCNSNLYAQRGYYDAPYKRYEAETGVLSNGAVKTVKSFSQIDLQSEASDQVCVNMNSANATVEYMVTEEADGFVIRYSVPDGQAAILGLYDGNTKVTTLILTSTWSWQRLWLDPDPNNVGVLNQNPRMRFDEVRYKLPSKLKLNGTLKLIKESGDLHIDFVELEPVPIAITAANTAVVYNGDGSNLQTFINQNGGKTIFLPTGNYNINTSLYFGVANTKLQGAGMWYTHLNFTNTSLNNGGLVANAIGIGFADLFLTTNSTSRGNSYKAINGVFTSGSLIQNVWTEHFVCGAWIGQYNTGGPAIADGFKVVNCRFRNNYADGINLCKGTSNAIVEHCNFRNNGDDDQAIWSADNLECINNTFRYNTSENCWRASGIAIYGGKNNKAHHLIIKDNLEAGIKVNNGFPGVAFNSSGLHEIHDITVKGCGTFNDSYNNQVGAVDILVTAISGTQVKNISFKNIDIIDSKNDAIFIVKNAGDGFYNLTFENIIIKGTGLEYPFNNKNNLNWGRGYFVLFAGNPSGNASYCGMNYTKRGGNAGIDVEKYGIGTLSWLPLTGCATPKLTLSTNTITVASIASNTKKFDITSNIKWLANSDEDWLDLSSTSDSGNKTITLTALANPTVFSRTANINVYGNGVIDQTIKVIQNALGTGIDYVENVKVDVYPNPASNILYFNSSSDDLLISIFDISGTLLFKKKLTDNSVDISILNSGFYTIKIEDKNKITSSKFIKM